MAYKTLIDIANSRPDVLNTAKGLGDDPFTAGTKANQWLNNWWNQNGVKEMPDVSLVPPGDPRLNGNNGADQGGNLNDGANNALAQGMGSADTTLDDYLKMLSSQSELSPDETSNIRKNLGIDKLETDVFNKPSKTSEQLYQDAYSTAGLSDIKAKVDELNKIVNQKKSDLIKKVGTINENPWMSETSRLRSVRDAISLAQEDMGNVVSEMNQYKELYNTGLNEVNNFVTRNQNDFTAEQNQNKDKLAYLLKKAEETATAAKSGKMEKLYRYVPEFLKSKTSSKKPDTLNTDQGQFAWNSKTGKFEIIPGTETAPKLDTSIVEINGRKVLVDNQTGATVKDLGAATKAGGGEGTTKQLSDTTINSYQLPTNTTEGQYNAVLNATNKVKSAMSNEPYENQWGTVVDWMRSNGYDPSAWDTYLWKQFNPKGYAEKTKASDDSSLF